MVLHLAWTLAWMCAQNSFMLEIIFYKYFVNHERNENLKTNIRHGLQLTAAKAWQAFNSHAAESWSH